jgi:hypothetical protein
MVFLSVSFVPFVEKFFHHSRLLFLRSLPAFDRLLRQNQEFLHRHRALVLAAA